MTIKQQEQIITLFEEHVRKLQYWEEQLHLPIEQQKAEREVYLLRTSIEGSKVGIMKQLLEILGYEVRFDRHGNGHLYDIQTKEEVNHERE